MSWIREKDTRTWFQRLAGNTLKQGPMPNHIAFIMDGNRRYAKERNIPTISGHKLGLDIKMSEVLRWCVDLGINEVTMYWFSKHNFDRSPEEVANLFQIFSDKLQRFLDANDTVKDGLRFQFVGIWSLIPPKLQYLMSNAIIKTKENTRITLNIAIGFSSRHLINDGVRLVAEGLLRKEIKLIDIDENLVKNAMQFSSHQNVDVLVRTSETRLSDFFLWESSEGQLCFNDTLWPLYSYWNLLEAVMLYQTRDFSPLWQVYQMAIIQKKITTGQTKTTTQDEQRKEKFMQRLRQRTWGVLHETKKMIVE